MLHDINCFKQDVKMIKFHKNIFEKYQADPNVIWFPNTSVRILIMWR